MKEIHDRNSTVVTVLGFFLIFVCLLAFLFSIPSLKHFIDKDYCKCGELLAPFYLYCKQCGLENSKFVSFYTPRTQYDICECGWLLRKEENYCTKCGRKKQIIKVLKK